MTDSSAPSSERFGGEESPDETDVTQIDPNTDRCPWCGKARIWKGRHAAAQHPEEWGAFKNYFEREQSGSVTWRKP